MKTSCSYPGLSRNVEQNVWPSLNGVAFFHFNSGNVLLSPYMCIYCFPKSPLTTGRPIYWKNNSFYACFELLLSAYSSRRKAVCGAVAWPGAGKGPVASLPHKPCPSQCGDILNHMVGMWPCPWRDSSLFSLPSPCDGIIPAHLVDLMVILNSVHPHICQVQMFVGWHCAGGDVDRVESMPLQLRCIKQCGPLNQ